MKEKAVRFCARSQRPSTVAKQKYLKVTDIKPRDLIPTNYRSTLEWIFNGTPRNKQITCPICKADFMANKARKVCSTKCGSALARSKIRDKGGRFASKVARRG